MNESILDSIKKMLGLDTCYEAFDKDIIMHINGVFLILNQLGVGPESTFVISSNKEKWSDFLKSDNLEIVKSYIYIRVKKIFDPPSSSSYLNSMDAMIAEYEWRMRVETETPRSEV